MSGHDIGEKPYHQRKRLGEDSQDFRQRDQRYRHFQPPWHIRPENVFPVMSVREQVHRHESADCQSEGNGYVPRSIRSAGEDRHYSHEIVHQYEEEGGEQIRGVFPAVVSGNGRFYDIIVDECYHRFQNGRYPCRGFVQHIVLPVPARASKRASCTSASIQV